MDWWSKLFWATGDADRSLQYKYKSYHTLTVRVLGEAAYNLPWEGPETWPWFVREPPSGRAAGFALFGFTLLGIRSCVAQAGGVDDLELQPSCLYLLGVSTASKPALFSLRECRDPVRQAPSHLGAEEGLFTLSPKSPRNLANQLLHLKQTVGLLMGKMLEKGLGAGDSFIS